MQNRPGRATANTMSSTTLDLTPFEEIVLAIRSERLRQDEKFGANRDQHPFLWLAILGEEVGEANKAALDLEFDHKRELKDRLDEYEAEIIQVAAVAVAMLENIKATREIQKHSTT